MSFSFLLWNASIQLCRSFQILADFLHSLNRLSGICFPSLSNSLWSTANVNQQRSTPTNLFLSKPWGQKETPAIQDVALLRLFSRHLYIYNQGHAASFANAVATKRRTTMCSQAGHWSQRTCSQCPLGLACCLKHRTTSSDRDEKYTRWIEKVLKFLLQNSPEGSTVLFPWFPQQVEMGHIACGNSRV